MLHCCVGIALPPVTRLSETRCSHLLFEDLPHLRQYCARSWRNGNVNRSTSQDSIQKVTLWWIFKNNSRPCEVPKTTVWLLSEPRLKLLLEMLPCARVSPLQNSTIIVTVSTTAETGTDSSLLWVCKTTCWVFGSFAVDYLDGAWTTEWWECPKMANQLQFPPSSQGVLLSLPV